MPHRIALSYVITALSAFARAAICDNHTYSRIRSSK